jgi:hypothetical protein
MTEPKIGRFQVRTVAEGTLLSQFDDPKAAEFASDRANGQAEALGVNARYEVKDAAEEPAVA